MIRFTIKVPNHVGGFDLGEFDAEALPRKGDEFVLYHPALCSGNDPFIGEVSAVVWESTHKDHHFAAPTEDKVAASKAEVVVWLTEQHAAPTIFCTCSERQRLNFPMPDNRTCGRCGYDLSRASWEPVPTPALRSRDRGKIADKHE